VTEQLGRDQGLGDSGTVYTHKRAPRPLRVFVDRSCEQFFTGTSFAQEQDSGVRGSYTGHS
jgi:hypothetical protein